MIDSETTAFDYHVYEGCIAFAELSAVEAACLPFLTIDTRQAAEDLCYQRYKGSTGPGNLPLQCQDIIGGLEANSDEYEILIRQYSMCLAENGFTIVDSNGQSSLISLSWCKVSMASMFAPRLMKQKHAKLESLHTGIAMPLDMHKKGPKPLGAARTGYRHLQFKG